MAPQTGRIRVQWLVLLVLLSLLPGYAVPAAMEKGVHKDIALTVEEREFLKGKRLRLGIDSARPPLEYVDEKGAYVGISAEFIQELATRLGVEILPQRDIPWREAVEKAKAGEIDVIVKMTPTAERQRYLLFTQPYVTFPDVIVTRKDTVIKNVEQLHNRKIGVIKGLVVEESFKQDHPDLTYQQYGAIDNALRDVSMGTIDAFVDNLGAVTYYIDKLGLTNLHISGTTPYTHDIAMGVRQDWPLLASALDKGLASMTEKEQAAIRERWLMIRYDLGVDWRTVGIVGVVLVVVLVAVCAWIIHLKRVVRERQQAEQTLADYTRQLELRTTVKTAVADLISSLQEATTCPELAQTFLSQAGPLLGIDYGLFSILDNEAKLFIAAGGYALAGDQVTKQRFELGQGLAGQCAFEKRALTLTGATETPIRITWGSGSIAPREVLFQPIVQRDKTIGVLELATLKGFTAQGRLLLEELLPVLAMNIEILDRTVRTQALLAATQNQAERLSLQQVELLEASAGREEANQALQQQVAELAEARSTSMRTMEALEASKRQTEEQNLQMQRLLDETSRQAAELLSQQTVIKETEEWYRGIIESAPDGMLIIDEPGRILLTNTMLDRMFGYQPGELLGRMVEELLPHSARAGHEARRQSFIQAGAPRGEMGKKRNLFGLRKGEEEFSVEVGLSLLPALGEHGRCVCATVRDITERRNMEESLRQQMGELERFYQLTINREEKMIQLKEEVNNLLEQMHKDKKYTIVS